MAFNIDNPVGTGTDAELLEFTRATIARVTLHGTAYTTAGVSVTRADLPALWEQVRILEARINAANSTGDSKTNYARMKRAL